MNLVCIKEVAIRTTTLCVAGLIYYTFNLATDIQRTRYKNMLASLKKKPGEVSVTIFK